MQRLADRGGKSKVDAALAAIQGRVLQQSGAYIVDEDGGKVAFMMDSPTLSEAYKRRMVAAVNACAGISLEQLRALGVGGLNSLLERAMGPVDGGVGCGDTEEQEGDPRTTRTVYVVAWHYTGGAGFDWYGEESDAKEAYDNEKINCTEMKDCLWTAYMFPVQVGRKLVNEEITRLIDGQLDELCAKSKQRHAAGAGMLLAA